MKPLSKRQRDVLQEVKDGSRLFVNDGRAFLSDSKLTTSVHDATFNNLLKSGHIQPKGLDVYYTITSSGLTALAKPTRNRGKKKKPVIENAHEKIMA